MIFDGKQLGSYMIYNFETCCRACGSTDLKSLLSFGDTPPSMIEVNPASVTVNDSRLKEDLVVEVLEAVDSFSKAIHIDTDRWKSYFDGGVPAGKKTLLWGGGSKAVAHLTTMGISEQVQYVVDVNPHRQETFLAGYEREIVISLNETELSPKSSLPRTSIR